MGGLPKVILVLCKVAGVDPCLTTITTQGSAHATLRSTRMTLILSVFLCLTWRTHDLNFTCFIGVSSIKIIHVYAIRLSVRSRRTPAFLKEFPHVVGPIWWYVLNPPGYFKAVQCTHMPYLL